MVEQQLDAMIRRRDTERRKSEGERREEELWQESERQYQAKRQAELIYAWVSYHEEAASRALANGKEINASNKAQIKAQLGGTNAQSNGH